MSLSRTIDSMQKSGPLPLQKLTEAKGGNRDAFDELIEPLLPDLRSFVAAKVDSKEADDIIQDVLVSAWKAIPNFDGRSKLRTWLFGICIHKIKDHYRLKMRRIQEVPFEDSLVEPVSDALGAQTEMIQAIRSYIRLLSPSQAEVIELYYDQGLTLAEVSSVLDRNLNTVKYQFCQAHFRLSNSMKDGGFL